MLVVVPDRSERCGLMDSASRSGSKVEANTTEVSRRTATGSPTTPTSKNTTSAKQSVNKTMMELGASMDSLDTFANMDDSFSLKDNDERFAPSMGSSLPEEEPFQLVPPSRQKSREDIMSDNLLDTSNHRFVSGLDSPSQTTSTQRTTLLVPPRRRSSNSHLSSALSSHITSSFNSSMTMESIFEEVDVDLRSSQSSGKKTDSFKKFRSPLTTTHENDEGGSDPENNPAEEEQAKARIQPIASASTSTSTSCTPPPPQPQATLERSSDALGLWGNTSVLLEELEGGSPVGGVLETTRGLQEVGSSVTLGSEWGFDSCFSMNGLGDSLRVDTSVPPPPPGVMNGLRFQPSYISSPLLPPTRATSVGDRQNGSTAAATTTSATTSATTTTPAAECSVKGPSMPMRRRSRFLPEAAIQAAGFASLAASSSMDSKDKDNNKDSSSINNSNHSATPSSGVSSSVGHPSASAASTNNTNHCLKPPQRKLSAGLTGATLA